jgi:hypothetical protein
VHRKIPRPPNPSGEDFSRRAHVHKQSTRELQGVFGLTIEHLGRAKPVDRAPEANTRFCAALEAPEV